MKRNVTAGEKLIVKLYDERYQENFYNDFDKN